MAAGSLIARILLLCLLSVVNFSSAFPRYRSFVPHKAWQGGRQNQVYGYGNRRPFQYIQTLRQSLGNAPPDVVRNRFGANAWQNAPGGFMRVPSSARQQNIPSPYRQTLRPYQPLSDVATRWPQKMSPPKQNYPLFRPRGFEFSLNIPFLNLGQNKGTNSTTEGSDLNGDGGETSPYRPSSVQIQSSSSSPSGSDLSSKGSTKGIKNAHEVSKPSFQFSLSIPVPLPTPSPNPSSSKVAHLPSLVIPGGIGFVQNEYMEPAKPQSSSTQIRSGWPLSISTGVVKQQTQQQTYQTARTKPTDGKLTPGYSSQYTTLPKQIGNDEVPAKWTRLFANPELSKHLSPSLMSPKHPLPYVYSGYNNSGQMNPTRTDYDKGQTVSPDPTKLQLSLSTLQNERVLSGLYTARVKPSDNSYVQGQPDATPPIFASGQYNYNQFKPSTDFKPNFGPVPHLKPLYPSLYPSPANTPPQYKPPSIGSRNREVASTTNHEPGNVGQNYYFSSSPYQYNDGPSGQNSPSDHRTAFNFLTNFRLPSTPDNQMGLPGQDAHGLVSKNKDPTFDIDMEVVTGGVDRPQNSWPLTTNYGGASGTWTGQNMEPPIKTPVPSTENLPSLVSVSPNQLSKPLNSNYQSRKPQSYITVYNPEKQMETENIQTYNFPQQHSSLYAGSTAGVLPTNFGQQLLAESHFHPKPIVYSPITGQNPLGPAQQLPAGDQLTTYGLNHYSRDTNYPVSIPVRKRNMLII